MAKKTQQHHRTVQNSVTARKTKKRDVTLRSAKKATRRDGKMDRFRRNAPFEISELIQKVNELPTDRPDFEQVLREAFKDEDHMWVMSRYEAEDELFEARKLLRAIARAFAKDEPTGSVVVPNGYPFSFFYRLKAEVSLDEAGALILDPASTLATLLGLPVRQIRICHKPECSRLFWATRPSQRSCSTQCAGAMRARRFRNPEYWARKENKNGNL
jgi:hypothetical protein